MNCHCQRAKDAGVTGRGRAGEADKTAKRRPFLVQVCLRDSFLHVGFLLLYRLCAEETQQLKQEMRVL